MTQQRSAVSAVTAASYLRTHVAPGSGAPGTEAIRVERIAVEAASAFRLLAGVRRAVSVFGSARDRPARDWSPFVRETIDMLAREKFAIITGGGPGIMALANHAAFQGGVSSIGLTIELNGNEPANPWIGLRVPFHYFFLRKLAFIRYGCAFVCFPGGYGTLDELFEALNLKRTHKLSPFPVILAGSRYWLGLVDWLKETAVRAGCLEYEDLDEFEILDDPRDIAMRAAECHATLCRNLGLPS